MMQMNSPSFWSTRWVSASFFVQLSKLMLLAGGTNVDYWEFEALMAAVGEF